MQAAIMVIDDSASLRQEVALVLRKADFDVLEASDGAEALDKLKSATHVKLALCDINMPGMDGLEFLAHVQRERDDLSVVMLTTEGQPALLNRAKALGAKGWIVKPFKPESLLTVARRFGRTNLAERRDIQPEAPKLSAT